MKTWVALAALAMLAAPIQAKQRTVIEDLPKDIIDNNYIAAVDVQIGETAAVKITQLDAKAAEKGEDRKDDAAATDHPDKSRYATLNFASMFPLVMEDVTREWGLTPGRGKPVKLRVTIESIKTANAAMAILISSSDELAGQVEVYDQENDARLGSFYVHVVNSHGGLAGLAMRGGGIREKLSEEFALESARILTGSTKKEWKRRVREKAKAEEASARDATAKKAPAA